MLLGAVNLDVIFLLVKDKFVPSHSTKAYGDSGGRVLCILNLGTSCKCSASCSSSFNPHVRDPHNLLLGGWTGSRTRLDNVKKRKIPCLSQE